MNKSKKGRGKMPFIIILIIIAVIVIGGSRGWSKLQKEHKEAKSLPIASINFKKLKDGSYTGYYEGGMYQWRTNEVQVTVAEGKVTDIKLLQAKEGVEKGLVIADKMYSRIIDNQSLQVDAVSGATLTSKAYIKGVENALQKAK